MSNLNPLQNPFVFSSHDMRTATDADGSVWFCAKDACEILGIKNHRDAVANLGDEERDDVGNTDTPGGQQTMVFVSEPGLYRLIFRSNKPEAVKFQKWVTGTVLPQIRKQGFYGQLTAGNQIALRYQKIKLLEMLAAKPGKFVAESVQTSLGVVCSQLGEPMPDLKLLEEGQS